MADTDNVISIRPSCTVEDAYALAAAGCHVFPLIPGAKEPAIDRFPERATRDPHTIAQWWQTFPGANVGISTSGYDDSQALVVVDVDMKNGVDGWRTIQALELEGNELPATREQTTATGGSHLIYTVPAPVNQRKAGFLGPGIDVRSKGGFIVGAGSVVDGQRYATDNKPIAPAPGWLVARLGTPTERKEPAPPPENIDADRAVERARYYLQMECPTATAGARNDSGYRAAAKVKDWGVDQATCLDLMLAHWPCEPALDADEVEHIVCSAFEYGQQGVGSASPEAHFEPVDTSTHPPAASSGELMPFRDTRRSGAPKATIGNLRVLLQRHGIRVGYDVIAKRTTIRNPHARYATDGAENTALSYVTSLAAQAEMPIGEIPRYIDAIARDPENVMNPARDFVRSMEWDGNDWFTPFADALQTPHPEMSRALLWRWMVAAVAAIERPEGVAAQGVLVLCGAQGVGKSRWVESLAPGELVMPGALLNPSDRDSVASAIAHWIVEIGELDATFRRTDLAQLKAFVTRDRDRLRAPYDKVAESYPRRTVFAATVNGVDFLSDPTGNRRYWTIPVESIDLDHGIDVRAVWAQVAAAYDKGERWYLSKTEERQLAAINSEHTLRDPLEDMILARFDPTAEKRPRFLTATEIVHAVGIMRPDKTRTAAAGHVLREHFGARRVVQGRRGWWMPEETIGDGEIGAKNPDELFK